MFNISHRYFYVALLFIMIPLACEYWLFNIKDWISGGKDWLDRCVIVKDNGFTADGLDDYTFTLTEEGKTRYRRKPGHEHADDIEIMEFYINEYIPIIRLQSFLNYYENYTVKSKKWISLFISSTYLFGWLFILIKNIILLLYL